MDEEKWKRECTEVVNAMKAHVIPFVTPIARATETQPGDAPGTTTITGAALLGTGNFVCHNGRVVVLTNEHVAVHARTERLMYKLHGSENYHLFRKDFLTIPYPTDAAISEVDQLVWSQQSREARAVPTALVTDRHNPVDRELLFVFGFSGERSGFGFNTLVSFGTPYLTQEPEPKPEIHSHHFALEYRPDHAIAVEPNAPGLPQPSGLSGSLVWDTKRVRCLLEGRKWSPELARVTGLLRFWASSSAMVTATKIEYVAQLMSVP